MNAVPGFQVRYDQLESDSSQSRLRYDRIQVITPAVHLSGCIIWYVGIIINKTEVGWHSANNDRTEQTLNTLGVEEIVFSGVWDFIKFRVRGRFNWCIRVLVQNIVLRG